MSRARLLVVLTRPAVAFLFCVYVVIGLARAGDTGTGLRLFQDLLVVIGFLIFSVAVNDMSDAPIDRQNLPGSNRPLVTRRADMAEMKTIAGTAAAVTVGAAALGRRVACWWSRPLHIQQSHISRQPALVLSPC